MTFEPQSGASRAPSTGSDSDSPEAAIDVTFESLGVDQGLINVLKKGGIIAPFAVQSGTIAAALQGRDVTAKAPTGSGKTLAFGIPLVQKGSRGRPMHPKSLVLAPTRELAAQQRCFAHWGPRANNPWQQIESRFVDEENRAPFC